MTKPQEPSLRFDHREIAVIFSLFIFVSLLMFTVGILVGKGMAAARYEEMLAQAGEGRRVSRPVAKAGTSVTLGEDVIDEGPEINVKPSTEASRDPLAAPQREPLSATPPTPVREKTGPLTWIPQKDNATSRLSESLLEPSPQAAAAAEDVLKNPRIRALLEEERPRRPAASSATDGAPKGAPEGKFTVQIGSYPTQKDAEERVAALKKLGFTHAYYSAKALGDQGATWYRVWLGYYPDFQSAKDGAEYLQRKGEVKNYLVRKTSDS